jgi:Tol biopolymer transport system component
MFKTSVLVVALVSSSVFAAPPDADKPAGEGTILIWKEGKHVLLSPEGKVLEELAANEKKFRLLKPNGKTVEIPFPEKSKLTDPSISPDGKRVAFIVFEAPPGIDLPLGRDRELNFLHNVYVCKPDGEGEGQALGINGQNLAWTPEGKLLVVEAASEPALYERKLTTWLVDVGTKEKTKLDIPETAQIFCVTPDGKSYIATTYDFDKKQFHLVSISSEGNKVSELTPLAFGIKVSTNFIKPRLSPDGSRILFLDIDKEEKLEEGMRRFPRLYLYDLKTEKREKLADVALDALIWDYAWSPDSKRVAYVWKRLEPGVPPADGLDKDGKTKEGKVVETETHLNVADPNGKNTKTILSGKGRTGPAITLNGLAWR